MTSTEIDANTPRAAHLLPCLNFWWELEMSFHPQWLRLLNGNNLTEALRKSLTLFSLKTYDKKKKRKGTYAAKRRVATTRLYERIP